MLYILPNPYQMKAQQDRDNEDKRKKPLVKLFKIVPKFPNKVSTVTSQDLKSHSKNNYLHLETFSG